MCSNLSLVLFLKRLRSFYHRIGLSHLVLVTIYSAFIVVGAFVFYVIENENEAKIRRSWTNMVDEKRIYFIRQDLMPLIFNNSLFYLHLSGNKTDAISKIIHR